MEATKQLTETIDERVIAMLSPESAPGFVRACLDEFGEHGLDLRIDGVSRNLAEVVVLAPVAVLDRHHDNIRKFWDGYAAGMIDGMSKAREFVKTA